MDPTYDVWAALAGYIGEQVALRLRPIDQPDVVGRVRARGCLECPEHSEDRLTLVLRGSYGIESAVLRTSSRAISRVRRIPAGSPGEERVEFDAGGLTCSVELLVS